MFTSQLVRFSNINTTFKGFKANVSSLILKLTSQGFQLAALRNKFITFYHSKLNIWGKFGIDIYNDIIELFN